MRNIERRMKLTFAVCKRLSWFSTHMLLVPRIARHICSQTQPKASFTRGYLLYRQLCISASYLSKHYRSNVAKETIYFISGKQPCFMFDAQPLYSMTLIYCPLLSLKRTFSSTSCALYERNDSESEETVLSDPSADELYEKWSQAIFTAADCHSVLVIQPYVKWGMEKKRNTTPELQLAEAVALVHSLYGWKVVEKMTIGMMSFEKKTFFGSGNMDTLKKQVSSDKRITAVFISTRMLKGIQHRELTNLLGVPVFDRYTLIIHLFRQHAVTREAKLQVAMAEIPYVRSLMRGAHEGPGERRGAHGMGGGGETSREMQKLVFQNREVKIKHALTKLRNHRELLRVKRKKLEYPVIAVVGYTNAGKTSLIKALTGDESMQPKNRLFATLDVTTHMGILPCRLKVLYVDTVGFISDIPTNLLESFIATLEDALLADLVLHVRDLSHPDGAAQIENVNTTLRNLRLPKDILDNIVMVGNKEDLVQDLSNVENVGIPVSATTLAGIENLKKNIEETILRVTGRVSLIVRAPMGGQEARWLYKEATVTETKADPQNSQLLLMNVIITETQLSKFRHYFINNGCASSSS